MNNYMNDYMKEIKKLEEEMEEIKRQKALLSWELGRLTGEYNKRLRLKEQIIKENIEPHCTDFYGFMDEMDIADKIGRDGFIIGVKF